MVLYGQYHLPVGGDGSQPGGSPAMPAPLTAQLCASPRLPLSPFLEPSWSLYDSPLPRGGKTVELLRDRLS